MRCLVVGYGSIGKRHVRILKELGKDVKVVSQHLHVEDHQDCSCINYSSLSSAFKKEIPDYVIIATPTADHFQSLKELIQLEFQGIVMVEKPIFDQKLTLPKHRFKRLYVGYNLRLHPILQRLNEILKEEKILSFHAYVGQYLPDWRPTNDYRQSYSASKKMGGGVLRDLSHELDYINLFCGEWKRLVSLGGHISNLEIDSDDLYSILFKTERCPMVHLHLNYLDRTPKREITINTMKQTIKADLIRGMLEVNDSIFQYTVNKDDTYLAQHKAILNRVEHLLCTEKEGVKVLELIEAIESSTIKGKWIER